MTRGHVNHHPIDRVKVKEGDAVVDVTLVGPETPGAQKQALEEGPQLEMDGSSWRTGNCARKSTFLLGTVLLMCRLCMVSCEMLERTSLIC